MVIKAIANGPIGFTDITGKFISVPVPLLAFKAGEIDASAWPEYTTYKAELDPWLKYLVQSGAITPGEAREPEPAMLIEAAAGGLPGNAVKVEFSAITEVAPGDPTKTTFDAKITEKHTYKDLKPDTIKDIIGTEAQRGTQPGLVIITEADKSDLPKAGVYKLAGGGTSAKSSKDIDKQSGSGKAFTVEARSNGKAGDNIKVTIGDVDATAKTFSLTVEYEESIAGLKIGDLPAKLAGDPGKEFVLKVSPPPGGSFKVPAAGLVSLSHGAEQQPATYATATVLTET
jgi:hypothetical protein